MFTYVLFIGFFLTSHRIKKFLFQLVFNYFFFIKKNMMSCNSIEKSDTLLTTYMYKFLTYI